MRNLILVKHSLPEIVEHAPASAWRLSEEGQRRCYILADRLAPYAPGVLVTSAEPKAIETARIVGARLAKTVLVAAGLHEHDRTGVGYLGKDVFEATVARFFAHPDELVLGRETAEQAHRRFAQAVEGIIAAHAAGNLAIFAHGTVISLFVANAAGVAPFGLWQRLGLPSFVVLTLPELQLVEIVENMGT